jgi:hypothetical protein
VAAIARRGRRQLAGTAAQVAAVVAAGLVLPARVAGRSTAERPLPATAPARTAPLRSPGSVPGAFHVTLDAQARVQAFHLALSGSRSTGECGGGLVVFEHPRKRG